MVKRQDKISFGDAMSYAQERFGFEVYTFKGKVLFDKHIYQGFAISEMSNIFIIETSHDILQPIFGQNNIQIHCLDYDSFFLSIKTKDLTNDLLKLQEKKDMFDSKKIDEDPPLYCNKNTEVIGKVKNETTDSI